MIQQLKKEIGSCIVDQSENFESMDRNSTVNNMEKNSLFLFYLPGILFLFTTLFAQRNIVNHFFNV